MRFDSHVHSAASPDSQMDPVEAVSVLRQRNLGTIFTEHIDSVSPVEKADPDADDLPATASGKDFIADFSVYPREYEKLRTDDVLLGLEVGLTKAYANLNAQTVEQYEYDFVIGSVHFIDGHDIYTDYFNYPLPKNFDELYRRVLTYSREVVQASGFFDSLGHIDYASRVSPFSEPNILYDSYPDEYDALLKLLAERETALELNTKRLGDEDAEKNLFKIFKRFMELDGRFVTIGSDAHDVLWLGRNYERAEEIVNEAGLTPVYFKKRKMCIM